MEQRRMTGSGMWTNFFAGVLAAIAFSPVCLSAAPELATANGNDTAITQNSVQMLEPEYFKLGIKYTNTTYKGYYSWITSARLVGIEGIPGWQTLGLSMLTDGTMPSLVYTLNFVGVWEFVGELTLYDDHFYATARQKADCALVFALTEDENGNAKWRIYKGRLPIAVATSEGGINVSGYWGLCVGDGDTTTGGIPFNNDLSYEYREPHEAATTSASQTLTASECISNYPVFALLSDNIVRIEFPDDTYYDHTRAAITLETGAKEPGMEDVTILDPEL